jgi:hypothetical protein
MNKLKQLQEEAREELKRIKEEWEKHETMNTCSVCDSPEGHTRYEDLIDTLIEKIYNKARKDLIEEDIKRLEGKKQCVPKDKIGSVFDKLRAYNQAIEEEINYKNNK